MPKDLFSGYPTPRGDLTKEKLKRYLRDAVSLGGRWAEMGHSVISGFSSPEEFERNLYWHGTANYIQGGLRPSILMSERDLAQGTGGGYGDAYWGVSLSKCKDIASNFTSTSSHGSVYPVLLKPEAKIKEMPELSDACELEDIILDLWRERVDAVKLGDWGKDSSEQELCVINPKSIVLIKQPTHFSVYQKKKFLNPSPQLIRAMYEKIISEIPLFDSSRKKPKEERRQDRMNLSKVFSPDFERDFSEQLSSDKLQASALLESTDPNLKADVGFR